MPITAKFSKAFYDKLGHEIADEMVNWFNQADTAYRTQLRELNDLNYARFEAKLEQFDAKMDQRFVEQDAKLEARFAAIDQRFAEQDAKSERRFAIVDQRFAEQDTKSERRFGESDTKWERRFGDLSARVDKIAAIVEAQPHAIQANLLKWMVVLWATTILAIVGLR